jgi:tRNA-Thr(GGU) m(6)t(6)A37 methyltransferase TsaA
VILATAMSANDFVIHPIGVVTSPIKHPQDAPNQGDESDIECWIHFHHEARPAAQDLRPDDHLIVLTWLHAARRDLLVVHPRGDQDRPLTGVFSTRAPHRPNPIGLHEITVVDKKADAVLVRGLEAIDGTPVVDLKPVLEPQGLR